jgi:hypothetical protein
LFLGPPESGRDRVTERDLRPIAAMLDWGAKGNVGKGGAGVTGRAESGTRSQPVVRSPEGIRAVLEFSAELLRRVEPVL